MLRGLLLAAGPILFSLSSHCACSGYTESIAEGNGGRLGSRLHVQLDNTCGDERNKTVIAVLEWLVYADVTEEAGFTCLMKGHTFTVLDQSFRTLIKGIHQGLCGVHHFTAAASDQVRIHAHANKAQVRAQGARQFHAHAGSRKRPLPLGASYPLSEM
eukprot:6205843-Pleurochrysis_carterae.AAC.3